MERRRVVITGLGAVTPIGLTAGESWTAVKSGVCGIGPITHYDPAAQKVKLAAEVKGFDPEALLGRQESKRMGRFTQFAVAAAREALADAGFSVEQADPDRCGVILSSGIGGQAITEAEHSRGLEKGFDRVSPFYVPTAICNMAAGQVAIDAGFRAMMDGQLDELGRLEAAEHLSYCDQCMDRYTALLTADALETPPKSMQGAVMGTIWARLMQNTYGRAAVAGVAAVLALTLWRSGALQQITQYGAGRETVLETDQSQLWEPGQNDPAPENTLQYRPIEDDRPQAAPEQLGRPMETKQDRRYAGEGSSLLHKLLTDVTDKIAGNTPNTEK